MFLKIILLLAHFATHLSRPPPAFADTHREILYSFYDKNQFKGLFNIIFFRNIQFKKLFNNLCAKKIQLKILIWLDSIQ